MGRKTKTKIKQCCVLVKWIDIAVWDVIEAELAFKNESKLAEEVNTNSDDFIGQVLDFVWKEGEEQSPGTLLGYGLREELETKRTNLMLSHYKRIGESVPDEGTGTILGPREIRSFKDKHQAQLMTEICGPSNNVDEIRIESFHCSNQDTMSQKFNSLRAKYENLKAQHKRDKAELRNLREEKSVMAQLKDLIRQLENSKQNRQIQACDESILSGNFDNNSGLINESQTQIPISQRHELAPGVFIDKGMVATMLRTCTIGTKFARALFVALFNEEEIINSSLSGRCSNAHKDKVPKKALDSQRINAIIGYTLKKYPSTTKREIHDSLANKIKELAKKNQLIV